MTNISNMIKNYKSKIIEPKGNSCASAVPYKPVKVY